MPNVKRTPTKTEEDEKQVRKTQGYDPRDMGSSAC